ncbi:hypothetical protein EXE44_16310 [Halorubrum sp. SS7]|nr:MULTISPECIES: hypothetical protein [unclassified Halorubrum]TKX55372.1 hypothetical protein EXE44_16310 [Halorubrum sp. SS7]TKX65420.1 hypothetical protein EXE45_16130 [Halorubrum sp. SP9]
MVSVRKASSDLSQWESSLPGLSNGQLVITSVEVTDVVPLFEEYPYSDQQILKAQFKYETTNPFDESVKREYSGELSYRSGSDIILVSTESDTPSSGEIIQKLGKILPENVDIYPGLFPTRQAIWNFIKEADEVLEVEVLYNGEIRSHSEIDDLNLADIAGEYIVERADIVFERNKQNILVTYADDSLNIQNQGEKGEINDDTEFITQIFEREVINK